jgi:1-deoxy-D-xylulose-5-phosphate reductoisomerase
MGVELRVTRRVTILGATGSVGRQALDVVAESDGCLMVLGLAVKENTDGLLPLIGEHRPRFVAVTNPAAAESLKGKLKDIAPGSRPEVLPGQSGLLELAGNGEADLVLNAVVGSAGLLPTLAALDAGLILALANKESLVMAGPLVMEKAAASGVLVPVDSEHSSLFRCMMGRDPGRVRSVTLTGSGGSLKDRTVEDMKEAEPEEVLRHPVWNMGRRITVDSATLMNKGLEVIEAQHLLGVDLSKINVVIHPQAFVHGLVELEDGTLLAHLSEPNMKIPIAYALYYPAGAPALMPTLDLAEIGNLAFERPDLERFPCLCLGYRAADEGGTLPAVLNAADEVAVEGFLKKKIRLTEIAEIAEKVMDDHEVQKISSAEQVLEADRWARDKARSYLPP